MREEEIQQFQEKHPELSALTGDRQNLLAMLSILRSTEGTFCMNRRLMQKIIDTSWVEAIEKGLSHLDTVLRNPRRTIEDVEEIVPIALSRKITVESVKHLAQHTDLIQSVDKRTGKITPSKILNVYKEETLMTYENKFINTLIDRLYTFINLRYEKLAKVAKDEEVFTLGFETAIDDHQGGKMRIEVRIENEHSLETRDHSGYTIWQRVEKLKKIIEGYKGSELCKTLGNTFIRPPVMRTNAIMKNIDLKACLTLWQYILSYDKVGYEINIENSAVSPQDDFIEDFYELVGLHLLLFRSSTEPEKEQNYMEIRRGDVIEPKIVRKFGEEVGGGFDVETEGVAGYLTQVGSLPLRASVPRDVSEMVAQIDEVIAIERAYQQEKRSKELAEQQEAQALERRRLEEERIEAERQAELQRIEAEKEAQERLVQEMLEKKRLEQEEEDRIRAEQEKQRLALLEEKRKQEEAEQARLAEERRIQEEKDAAERERQRIAQEKHLVRSELGEAAGVKPKEEVSPAAKQTAPEHEDPAAVAARIKREQQQREKERAEAERAQRLKAERQYFENKPFEKIRREYSRNPFWMLIRLIRHILAMVFGIIPENTDRPDYKERRLMLQKQREEKQREKDERLKMEVYYKKYGQTFRYRTMRKIQDRKFKRKREKERRSKPRPVYQSRLTPEQQAAVQKEMRALYKEYHVSLFERFRRWVKAKVERFLAWRKEIDDSDKKFYHRLINAVLIVLLGAALLFSVYVIICTVNGRPVSIFGFSVLRVETGSMEPTLHVSDYIIVQGCDPEELIKGDIISFYSDQEDIKGMLVTHRIDSISADGVITTRGDANPVADSTPVDRSKILGIYRRKSGLYSWLGSFADTSKLFLLLGLIPLSLISLYELWSLIRLGRKARAESKEDAQAKAREDYERRMREAIEAEKKRLEEEHYQPEEDEGDDK